MSLHLAGFSFILGASLWDGFWENSETQDEGLSEAAVLMERAGDIYEAVLYLTNACFG